MIFFLSNNSVVESYNPNMIWVAHELRLIITKLGLK